jgi:anti-sigma factor RsiW
VISDEKLMLYLDGELSREECRDIERELDTPGVKARVLALTQLRDVMRARMASAEEEAEPRLAGLWDGIRAGLGPASAPARPSLWDRAREWIESYRSHIMTGAVAAAAGALLAMFITGGRAPSPSLGAHAAEVESLEVLGGTGTVFHFPGPGDDKQDEGTTVVWVTPDEAPDSDVQPTTGGPI